MGGQPHANRKVTTIALTVSKRSDIWPHMQACSMQACSTAVCHRELETGKIEIFDQFLSIKLETEPTDLPTQEADSTETLTGTLRGSTFPMRSERKS